ncbi:general amidase [Pseudovirgaria hyperparasitica]|uniref:amidase n=1 Tax=Pseudovirgaria hyperparasitica TaxID=470096 RepID=A0A6A6W6N0_9PEZI|nr:general amidase [Pseudovirgaria hyperparasitica]KAF2757566.1 general amidase [Pseudovirgaria hyperparasitica]
MRTHDWRWVASQKTQATSAKIRPEWLLSLEVKKEAASRLDITGSFIRGLMSGRERLITEASTVDLAHSLQQGEYTATEVCLAYCKRAAFAHQLNNCLHEIFFDDAIELARVYDDYYMTNGKTIGPLHGLPVSLKDQFHVRHAETTMGYVGWVGTFEGKKGTGREFHDESQIVEELRSLGAIFYCKTSCPQTLLLGETVNNLIGSTMNPVHQMLSCGGSSGGEAALMALGGSSVGLGTDIGGSVRIPAAFCGVYAIKPSFGRFSYRTVANTTPGQTLVPSAIGFLSTTLPALELIMKSVLSTQPWLRDPDVVEIPWRDGLSPCRPKLCFAVLRNDGMVTPHPPIARGIDIVVEAVKKAGHEVVEWNPPSHADGTYLHVSHQFMAADGGQHIWKQLNILREPLIDGMTGDYGGGPFEPMPLLEYQDKGLRVKAYRAQYDQYWNSTAATTSTNTPVDAVIMPVAPHAAVLPDKYFHYGYTTIVDLLNYSAVSFPVTKAEEAIDQPDPDFKPMNDDDLENWEAYDAKKYDGAPVGVQIMGRRFDEERLLGIARHVDGLLASR